MPPPPHPPPRRWLIRVQSHSGASVPPSASWRPPSWPLWPGGRRGCAVGRIGTLSRDKDSPSHQNAACGGLPPTPASTVPHPSNKPCLGPSRSARSAIFQSHPRCPAVPHRPPLRSLSPATPPQRCGTEPPADHCLAVVARGGGAWLALLSECLTFFLGPPSPSASPTHAQSRTLFFKSMFCTPHV